MPESLRATVLLLLLQSGSAVADEPLTAQQVLTEARAHRQEIAAARARSEAALETPKFIGALTDPMLMGGLDHVPFSLMGANYSVQLQQDFPLSGIRGARRRSALAQAGVAHAQLQTTTLDVEASALRSFLMLVEAQRMRDVAVELRGLARQVHAAVQARIAGSQASLSEAVRAEVEVARMDGEVQGFEREVLGRWAMTEAAMGHVAGNLAVPDCVLDTPTELPPEVASLVVIAIDHRPELGQMRSSVLAAHENLEVMKAMYLPMAFVRLGFARSMQDGPGAMVMGGVSLPIWREKLGAGTAEASAMSRMAEADLGAMRTMLEGEVGAARQSVMAAQARFVAARDRILPLSRQAVRLSIVAYTLGQLPLVSVLDAARAQGEAQMATVRAEIELDAAWISLGRATGQLGAGP